MCMWLALVLCFQCFERTFIDTRMPFVLSVQYLKTNFGTRKQNTNSGVQLNKSKSTTHWIRQSLCALTSITAKWQHYCFYITIVKINCLIKNWTDNTNCTNCGQYMNNYGHFFNQSSMVMVIIDHIAHTFKPNSL